MGRGEKCTVDCGFCAEYVYLTNLSHRRDCIISGTRTVET